MSPADDKPIVEIEARLLSHNKISVSWSTPNVTNDYLTGYTIFYKSSRQTKRLSVTIARDRLQTTLEELEPAEYYDVYMLALFQRLRGVYSKSKRVYNPVYQRSPRRRNPVPRGSTIPAPRRPTPPAPRRSAPPSPRPRTRVPVRGYDRPQMSTPRRPATTTQSTPAPVSRVTSGQISVHALPVQELVLEDRLPDPDRHKFPLGDSLPLSVSLNISLVDVLRVFTKTNEVSFVAKLSLQWTDPALAWDFRDYGGLTRQGISTDLFWTPDVTVQGLTAPLELLSPATMSVDHRGLVTWAPVYKMATMCDVKSKSSPSCTLEFSSLSHDRSQLRLTSQQREIDVSSYFPGSAFHVGGTRVGSYDGLSFAQVNANFRIMKKERQKNPRQSRRVSRSQSG